MHIISSTDRWDLSTRQIDIGLLVSSFNSANSAVGSATIAINGHTVASNISVANKVSDDVTVDPYGADKSKLTIHSIYANITTADSPVTITVTAEESGADLLWCYAHSQSIPYVHILPNNAIAYGSIGNTKPQTTEVNVNIPAGNPIGNVELGGCRTIPSGGNVTVDITSMLGNIVIG
jgi:hypothetical protein